MVHVYAAVNAGQPWHRDFGGPMHSIGGRPGTVNHVAGGTRLVGPEADFQLYLSPADGGGQEAVRPAQQPLQLPRR